MIDRRPFDEISGSIRLPRRHRAKIARELASHMEEARRDLQLAGWTPEEAARESVARLGDPKEIIQEFERVYRPSARRRVGLAFGLAGMLLVGVYGASGPLASARSAHHAVSVHVVKAAPLPG